MQTLDPAQGEVAVTMMHAGWLLSGPQVATVLLSAQVLPAAGHSSSHVQAAAGAVPLQLLWLGQVAVVVK
jgi:hypothetical protein